MPRILVGVDGSDHSRQALGWGIREQFLQAPAGFGEQQGDAPLGLPDRGRPGESRRSGTVRG
jgi:hypothetical protein